MPSLGADAFWCAVDDDVAELWAIAGAGLVEVRWSGPGEEPAGPEVLAVVAGAVRRQAAG